MNAKLRRLLPAALLAVLGAWVYSPAFHGGWLSDDFLEITEHAALRTRAGLAQVWRGQDGADYLPLKSTVQWLEWHLWGDRVLGYHLVTVGLHLLSSFLIWRLLGRLGVRWGWLGGLLFAIHPLAVESVAWISEFKNTLSLPLLLFSFDAFQGRGGPLGPPGMRVTAPKQVAETARFSSGSEVFPAGLAVPPYLRSLCFFLAAMLVKSSVVMFPAFLLLYIRWRADRLTRRDYLATAPFFLTSLGLGLVTVALQRHRALEGIVFDSGGLSAKFAAAGISVVFYCAKVLAPVHLAFTYPRWSLAPLRFEQWIPGLALMAGLACLWRSAHRRQLGLGVGWFLLNLLPVLGFLPMAYARFSRVADHFAYLSLVGAVGLAAAAAGEISARCARRSPILRGTWTAAVIAICAALAWQSHGAAGVFSDEATLWTRTLQISPGAAVAHNNLGLSLLAAGRTPEAIAQFKRALELDPRYPEADNNLASAYRQIGRPAEAIPRLQEALRLDPGFALAHNTLGDALQSVGRAADAIAEYEAAVRLNPKYPEAHYNLGLCLFGLGRWPEAFTQYELALRLRPNFPEAENNLGVTLAATGQRAAAVPHYEAALRLRPDYPEAENNLGLALAKTGRLEAALPHFEKAVRLRPDYPEARQNLRVARHALGK